MLNNSLSRDKCTRRYDDGASVSVTVKTALVFLPKIYISYIGYLPFFILTRFFGDLPIV